MLRLILDGGSARGRDKLAPNEPVLVLEDKRHGEDTQ